STLQATVSSEPDLFWACRGGGGGSFGIATQFVLRIFALTNVLVFGVSWKVPQSHAAGIFSAWQTWAPNAPNSITSIMKLGPAGNGLISMRWDNQSAPRPSCARNCIRLSLWRHHLLRLKSRASAFWTG